jgi:hypothetical protein
MTRADAGGLSRALEQAEGYCELRMWESAWNVLEDLPNELRCHPEVLSRRLDCLIGLEHWDKALILGASLSGIMPQRADVWFRLACIRAQGGNIEAAKAALRKCFDIDPGLRLKALHDPMLEALW